MQYKPMWRNRYTRLSQKQVPQGLRVRVPPSAPLVFGVHQCLQLPPQANQMSTAIHRNPLLSTGFAVSIDGEDTVCGPACSASYPSGLPQITVATTCSG